jgi:hypothetical protein
MLFSARSVRVTYGLCCEIGSWKPAYLGRYSEFGGTQRGREAVDSECEGSTAFEAVTRRLVETADCEGVVRSVVLYLEPAP